MTELELTCEMCGREAERCLDGEPTCERCIRELIEDNACEDYDPREDGHPDESGLL